MRNIFRSKRNVKKTDLTEATQQQHQDGAATNASTSADARRPSLTSKATADDDASTLQPSTRSARTSFDDASTLHPTESRNSTVSDSAVADDLGKGQAQKATAKPERPAFDPFEDIAKLSQRERVELVKKQMKGPRYNELSLGKGSPARAGPMGIIVALGGI